MEDNKKQNRLNIINTFNKIIEKVSTYNFLTKITIDYLDFLRDYINSGYLLQEIQTKWENIKLYKIKNFVFIGPQELVNILTVIIMDNVELEELVELEEIKYFNILDFTFMQQALKQKSPAELLIDLKIGCCYIIENLDLIILKYKEYKNDKIEGILVENSNENEKTIKFEGSQIKLDSIKKIEIEGNEKQIKYTPHVDFIKTNFEEMLEIQLIGMEKSKKDTPSSSPQPVIESIKSPSFYLQKKNISLNKFKEKSKQLYFNNTSSIKNNLEEDIRPMSTTNTKQQFMYSDQINYNNSNDKNQYYVGQMIDARRCRQGRKTSLSQDRPFVCEVHLCNSAFKRYEHLKRHKKIHTGEKPFHCPFMGCDRRFARSDNMTQHMKLHNANKGRVQNTTNNKTNYDEKESPSGGFHNMYDRI